MYLPTQISIVHGFPVSYMYTCATRTRAAYRYVKVRRATRGAARQTARVPLPCRSIPVGCSREPPLSGAAVVVSMCVFMYPAYVCTGILYLLYIYLYIYPFILNSPSSL